MSDRPYSDHLNDTFFDGQLSPLVVERLGGLPIERDDARAFVERMFRSMTSAGFGATDVSPLHGDVLGSLLSRLLPGTWDGRVPPITVAGRHRQIDALVQHVAAADGLRQTFVDLACGFPPLTTVDTADALPGWEVTGIDRALPAYLAYDGIGNYAVFNAEGRATYFQPVEPSPDSWHALLHDWEGSRRRFEGILQTLLAEHARRGNGGSRIEVGGMSLDAEPVQAYERGKLRFVSSDLDDADAGPAGVVRCFNMLLYFNDDFRRTALRRFCGWLEEGGLLICGTDWAFTTESRYFSYRKRRGALREGEFAFSIDNLAPLAIVPWYTLHDDDRELKLLTTLVGVLRADADFIGRFLARSDALRAACGVCPRQADGYYGDVAPGIPAAELWRHAEGMRDQLQAAGFAEEAAGLLRRAGWAARVNPIGHVAVGVPDEAE